MIICSPQLGLSPESNLGGEVYDREMLKGLDALGVQTVIILPWGKKYPPLKHAKIYFLPLPFVYPPWLFNVLILPYLFFLYSKFKFDILRVHSPYFVGPTAILFGCIFRNVKIIPSYLHLEPDNKFYDLIDRLLLPRWKLITTISETTGSEIGSRYRIDTERIIVVPCGVEKKYRPVAKNKLLLKKFGLDGRTILLYLGQFIERKNITFLLKVIRELPASFVLVLCGDGSERKMLERMCSDENLTGKVVFTGFVLEKDKLDYYNLADVFLCPSLKEGFGLSVNEALACGKKVIASNLPVFNEITNASLVLVPLDVELWVKEIQMGKKTQRTRRLSYYWADAARRYLDVVTTRP